MNTMDPTRAAGWTEANSLSYALPSTQGTVTTWTR